MTGRETPEREAPLIIDLTGEQPLPPAPAPAEAPPVGTATEPGGPAAAETRPAGALRRFAGGGGSLIGRVFWWSVGGLALLLLAVWIEGAVGALFAASGVLGTLAMILMVAALGALVAMALRELAALARLRRVDRIRRLADAAQASSAPEKAKLAIEAMAEFYADRPSLEPARAELAEALAETPDAADRMALAERLVMAPLDARAEREIQRGARTVAASTALIPMAVLDVAMAFWANLRMIRTIAEIYGGRAGWIGSWRLLKLVAGHMVTTGLVSAGDDVLGPMLGGGALAKISRRFGEGLVNGALTARIGVATTELCRPLPFRELKKPTARRMVTEALANWRGRE